MLSRRIDQIYTQFTSERSLDVETSNKADFFFVGQTFVKKLNVKPDDFETFDNRKPIAGSLMDGKSHKSLCRDFESLIN